MVKATNWTGPSMGPMASDVIQYMKRLSAMMTPRGIEVQILTAAEQRRTACDVPAGWVRPRVPSKAAGRKGTRKAWKRRRSNWPHMTFTYREPNNMLLISSGARTLGWDRAEKPDLLIVTPEQAKAVEKAMVEETRGHQG